MPRVNRTTARIYRVGMSVITREEADRQSRIVAKTVAISRDHGLDFATIRRLTGLSESK